MWHVSSRSGVATLQTAMHLLLTDRSPTADDRGKVDRRIINHQPVGQDHKSAGVVVKLFTVPSEEIGREECHILRGMDVKL